MHADWRKEYGARHLRVEEGICHCTSSNSTGPLNPENARRCPPGHGDIYPSLLGSGLLERLRGAGINYVFVSNSDNLGATLDLDILAYFARSGNAFLMEASLCFLFLSIFHRLENRKFDTRAGHPRLLCAVQQCLPHGGEGLVLATSLNV